MAWLKPIILKGEHATLEPLSYNHYDELVDAAKDGELWNLWYTPVPKPSEMEKEISRRLERQEEGKMLPFVVINNQTGKVVGMTTYCHFDSSNKRLGIGWTWYAKSQQRTAINTECKQLLLTYAFEELKCIAVVFYVNYLNQQSRKAVERLGAKLDGIIRNHSIMQDGVIWDMCLYSILPNEWLGVKTNLKWLLDKVR